MFSRFSGPNIHGFSRNVFKTVALTVAALVVMGVSGCTPKSSSQQDEITKSASSEDCSPMWLSSDSVYVNVRSLSEEPILIHVNNVDCYDWDGSKNPNVLDNYDLLGAGAQTGFKELAMRPVPQSTISGDPVIRPWNMSACTKWGCGQFEPRFTYKFSKNRCNTTKRGQTACDGVSLCTDDPSGELVTSTAVIRENGEAFGEVTATVNCFISSKQTIILLDWVKY